MKSKTINFQEKKISYSIYGIGKPVLLLHGFGEDCTIWQRQIDALEQQVKLIVPDIPGSGQSAFLPGADIDTYAEIIKKICDAELAAKEALLCMIGHSMGGYITLAFAEKYPDLLTSFCLFHSSAFADDAEKKQVRAKAVDFINDKGALAFLKTSIPGLFTKSYAEAHPQVIAQLIKKAERFTNEALVQYYQAMIARPDRTAILKNFPREILFIIGEHDNAIPLRSSLKQCYLPGQSHVHILSQSGHMGMWEETDKANAILLSFLRGIK